ncbi:MAG: PA2169 family four-helix-bundle protein [Dysgonamonadaceae bacterium]|nr:PA2169 family four-helix-bundle protein [Dysgonamonadaceae bacterium]MDD4727938.1 PA2169 family four-helix-bundle protein [Dysgonamonadaceae bacterium]
MTTLENQARILNDLILINNDRVIGYQKAMEELKDEDSDLNLLFQEKVNQSLDFKTELVDKVISTGLKVEDGTTNAGKIYRIWMDVKAFFGGSDRKVVLDNCEDGEDAALAAYNDALTSEGLSAETRSMLTKHHAALKISHNRIKALREAQ